MTSALIDSDAFPAAPDRAGATTTRRPYLAPVPDCDPPFDDERTPVGRIQQLRRPSRTLVPVEEPARRRPLPFTAPDLAPTAGEPEAIADADVPGWSQDADVGVRRTATADLPPAARSGQMLARALVEMLSGQRPVSQLRVHCSPEVFAGLQGRPTVPGALSHLLTVRVCEPADGVAEISAAFRRGQRVRAIAFRIQGVDGRWRITALQTG
ncbi:hypothetical protein SAMN04515671_0383 [Nakamurella panacisegetis]|uniref:Alanine, arginine and proline rich protein n=1 Tax=Nakamurella panacisegetis TaxID=1090615 RepID=A0A1H0I6J0_9ACTN|nr:Rv3235 family protein [Nakamurella panacisegetis]SDO27049.1 hypothetical protein SAMN04515671_0383 [Nakamurella panacisegetis]